MNATGKYMLISTYWRTFVAEKFLSILFGINLLFIAIKLSHLEAMNRQKEEKIGQGSDTGSS